MHQRKEVEGIIYDSKSSKILLIHQDGIWKFPKGGVKQGEDEIRALRREMMEEIGLPEYCINKIVLLTKWKAHYGRTIYDISTYVCYIQKRCFNIKLGSDSGKQGPRPIEAWKWVSPNATLKMLPSSVRFVMQSFIDKILKSSKLS